MTSRWFKPVQVRDRFLPVACHLLVGQKVTERFMNVMSLRRNLVFSAVILCLLGGLVARPYGQRRPTLSGDLAHVQGDRIRLIVQPADGSNLSSVRGHLRGIVRRELEGSVALEVSRAEFDAMSNDAALGHISADTTVAADMALTNQVTGASAMWQGTSG